MMKYQIGYLVFGESHIYKRKDIFAKMLKDVHVGIEVPKSIGTRRSMQAKVEDDSMQQS